MKPCALGAQTAAVAGLGWGCSAALVTAGWQQSLGGRQRFHRGDGTKMDRLRRGLVRQKAVATSGHPELSVLISELKTERAMHDRAATTIAAGCTARSNWGSDQPSDVLRDLLGKLADLDVLTADMKREMVCQPYILIRVGWAGSGGATPNRGVAGIAPLFRYRDYRMHEFSALSMKL